MKNKLWSLLLTLTLIASSILIPLPVIGADEYFWSWTLYDPNYYIDIDYLGYDFEFTDYSTGSETSLYKDFGTDFFDANFQSEFYLRVTDDSDGWLDIWALSNQYDTYENIKNENDDALVLTLSSWAVSGAKLRLYETTGGNEYSSASYNISLSNSYYLTIYRDESIGTYGTLYCEIYDDLYKTELLQTISVALHKKANFRYASAIMPHQVTGSWTISGEAGNYDFTEAVAPAVDTLEPDNIRFDPWFEEWIVPFSANVTDDGGDEGIGAFHYQVKDSDNWTNIQLDPNLYGYFETGELLEYDMIGLEGGETYEYYATVTNSAGTGTGDTVEFTTEMVAGNPIVQTWGYPVTPDSENLTCIVYGEITYDGGSGCTGWFQYRLEGESEWTNTSGNTTGLETGDDFNGMLTALELCTTYEYQACAVNDSGNATGGISSFVLYGVHTPYVETVPATLVTDTTAYIHGHVTDWGIDCPGETSVASTVGWRYRRSGLSEWTYTRTYSCTGNDTSYVIDLSGLTPLATYEYQFYCIASSPYSEQSYTGYGNILNFTPYARIRTPILTSGNFTYLNNSYAAIDGVVNYDGGSYVTVTFQYRRVGQSTWVETEPTYNVESDEVVTHMTYELKYGKSYEYRIKGVNETGTAYGTILTSVFKAPDDTDLPDTPQTAPWTMLDSLLALWGMDNDAGHWLIILAAMIITFVIAVRSEVLRVVLPLMCFGAGIAIGWLDLWLVSLLAFGAGLTLYSILRGKIQGKGAKE